MKKQSQSFQTSWKILNFRFRFEPHSKYLPMRVYFLVGYTHFRFRGGSQRTNSHRMRLNLRGGTQRTNYFRVGNRKRMRYHRKGDNCWNLQNYCFQNYRPSGGISSAGNVFVAVSAGVQGAVQAGRETI